MLKDFLKNFLSGKNSFRFFRWDFISGLVLATFILPESMAYASLAGMPPEAGIYCCMAGGLFFAFFTTSRHVAIGPTSAISLMMASALSAMAYHNAAEIVPIAVLATLMVSAIFLVAYFVKLNSITSFISETILLGFKTGAALSIIITQLPILFGFSSGNNSFFYRLVEFLNYIPQTNYLLLAFGAIAMLLMFAGDKYFPGRPVSLFIVIAAILLINSSPDLQSKIDVLGNIPHGLPELKMPGFKAGELQFIFELAFAAFILSYIETISSERLFASKYNYRVDPRRELLSLSAANFSVALAGGFPVAGGLSQSVVNERAGAKSRFSLIFASAFLAVILLFFTGFLYYLPKVILAAIVIHAVVGLIRINDLKMLYRLSKLEFFEAIIALAGVLLFGILHGVLIAVILSIILLLRRIAYPNVAVLGRIGQTDRFSDVARHSDNQQIKGILILRVEASLLYFNSENIKEQILSKIDNSENQFRLIILDLSASSYVDVAGAKMLKELIEVLNKKHISFRIVEALAIVRDMLRKIGLEKSIGHISRRTTINDAVEEFVGDKNQLSI